MLILITGDICYSRFTPNLMLAYTHFYDVPNFFNGNFIDGWDARQKQVNNVKQCGPGAYKNFISPV